MATTQSTQPTARAAPSPAAPAPSAPRRPRLLVGGGTDGNERLTALAGSALLLPLLVVGITLLSLSGLMGVHLFVGLMLIPPVLLKMASTGYRFVRYYTRNAAYRLRGAPPAPLRMLAPLVALSTVIVLASGIALLAVGPGSRGVLVPVHKVSFIVWGVVTAVHVLAHLGAVPPALRGDLVPAVERSERPIAGRDGRLLSVAGALAAGAVLSVLLIPEFAAWVHWSSQAHHHH